MPTRYYCRNDLATLNLEVSLQQITKIKTQTKIQSYNNVPKLKINFLSCWDCKIEY